MANGLQLYVSEKCQELKGCEVTIEFCKRMNDLFDALNRKVPNQRVTSNSYDFQVLRSSIQWLNDWETAQIMGEINEHEFLTQETARGLRLSLQSTMNLCQYLEARYDFKYLLTGKVN
ncbi:uncharacterized protein LOC112588971 [Harpegnathos saltator]|uniref:uncharacterized protein LOC112588971 n=1 Tax=Harpegnathos saltator TaxID=610380 RepID=UPI000DBEDF00|nr:uncharacterized protein LOC112588971 [Harpegnathos saltator]